MNKKTERRIQDEIRLALSKYGAVFRTNAGDFWQGEKTVISGIPALINLRAVKGLPKGFTDLLFVGVGVVAFIETKRTGQKPREEQLNFMRQMRERGHASGVAHSVEEALEIIGVKI